MNSKVVFEGQTKTGLQVILRYPERSDLQAVWLHINTLSEERTFLLIQGITISLESERDWLDSKLHEIESGETVMLLAFAGHELAGTAEVRLGTGVKRHTGTFGIAITQPYRGKGLGELLMQSVIQESAERFPQLEIVELEVFGNNPVAMSLYSKMGFTEYGRLPGGVLHRGQPVDAVYMYHKLAR